MTPDQINSGFILTAGLLLLLNVRRLYHDKQLHGVCITPTVLMAAWGFWNLFFYPCVGAWWSFAAGILIVAVNTVWVGQMFYYKRKGAPWRNYTFKYTNVDKKELIERMRVAMHKIKFSPLTGAPLDPITNRGETEYCNGFTRCGDCLGAHETGEEAERCDNGMHGSGCCKEPNPRKNSSLDPYGGE